MTTLVNGVGSSIMSVPL